MAFNKNNKKIVTTALTAAMVASAVAPVAAATKTVTPAQAATKAVDAYYKLSVKTRADISNSAKVKVVAQKAIAKLTSKKDAKVKASLTAKVAKKSAAINKYYKTVIVPAETEAAAIKTVEAALKLGAETPVTADTTKEQVEALYTQVIALIGKVKTATKKAEFTAAADKLKADALAKIDELATPKVASATAINAKQLVVKFTTELNSDTNLTGDASEVALYTLDGTQASDAKLSDDKKSVTLTFANDVEGTDQVLVVNPVLTTKTDKNGALVKTVKHSQVFTYTDEVKPVVSGTTYTNGKIVVTYSEEIGTKPSVVRVNGNPVAASDINISATDATKVEITYAGLAAGSTSSLYIAGAKDSADVANEADLFNGTVIAPAADTAKPQITGVQVTGQNTAKVSLSEAISQATVVATLQKGTTQTAVTLVKDATDTTGKTYTLTVDLNGATAGDGIFSGTSTSESFTLFVAASAMTDLSTPGNPNDLFSTNVTFVKDVTAPVLSKSQVSTDSKKLEFTFSEDLTVAGQTSDIIIKNADGVRISAITAESVLKVGDNKTYLVDTKAGDVVLDAGTYTVTIPANYFTDGNGNSTTAVTSTFTVGAPTNSDTVKPTAAVSNVASSKNTFEVAFSEEVTSTALNVANYKLDGQSLPAGTEIYFTDINKNTVRIVLPTSSINIGDQTNGSSAILTVSGVADKAGNVINTANTSVIVKDNTSATIATVQVLGTDVYVTFNENVTVPATTNALAAFKITVNGVDLTAADVTDLSAVSGNAKQVKFSLVNAATPVVTVKAGQTVLTDANGVAVK